MEGKTTAISGHPHPQKRGSREGERGLTDVERLDGGKPRSGGELHEQPVARANLQTATGGSGQEILFIEEDGAGMVRPPELRHEQAIHVARHEGWPRVNLRCGLLEGLEPVAAITAKEELFLESGSGEPVVVEAILRKMAVCQVKDYLGKPLE